MKYYISLLFICLTINTSENNGIIILATNQCGNYTFQKILKKKKEIRIIGTYTNQDGEVIPIPSCMIQQLYPQTSSEAIFFENKKAPQGSLRHPAFNY